ncbi:lipoprotein [Petroclostridium sp. X23]|uniref:lipoprotein n=1 Tax=Petroclostridium sp. X23 TaxID=3045146 RepID=UPI0024AD7D60|nr:lipoprotein [Petroclostridium sp. X23]WHH60882.1 hypothetical protein QKW49_09345 [Petroclostridium sp. X23]
MNRIVFFLFFILVLAGCTQQEIKEGQVYVVKDDNSHEEQAGDMLNIEGRIPFQKYVNQSLVDQYNSNRILLTISPDGNEMYIMEKFEASSLSHVIMGDPDEKVRIIKEDIATKDQKIVIENIPFVSKVLWNTEGNMVAFGGGGKLTVYDVENNNVLMNEKLAQDTITNFFWSPVNEDKLYSEQPNLANGSIYYLASQKKVEAYETREETYYKGKLDSNYYYGTKWDLTGGDINTVILDKQGKIIKVLTQGRFRDAYQKSLLVVGETGFGLYYIRDINSLDEMIALTEEYVYDVKFVTNGEIAYTTKADDIDTNLFYLHIVDNSGDYLKKFKVYGGSVAVLPDGNSGYISGPEWQQVDFVQNKLVQQNTQTKDYEADDLHKIYATIRGAMTTLYDFELKGEQNWNSLKKYFKNTQLPEQWAYLDMEIMFKEKANRSLAEAFSTYMIKIEMKSYDINSMSDGASITIGVDTKNYYGGSNTMDYALELIKSEGNWYVIGFSTFPYSTLRKEIEEIIQETVDNIQLGKLFSGKLESKEINIGQIQFWRSGKPHLAPNIESADSIRVLLQVTNQGKEEIYKLVLEKVNQSYFEPVKLTKENLSSL